MVVSSAASATLLFQCCDNNERMTLGLGEDREVQAFSVVNGGEFSRIGHSAVSTRTKSMTFGFGIKKKKKQQCTGF